MVKARQADALVGKRVFIRTFGCQMNEKDSLRILGFLKGAIRVSSPEEADIVIVNTCAVREKPEHKVRSEVGKYLKLRTSGKDLIVGIAGCVAQLKGHELLKELDVNFVVGPGAVHRIKEIVEEALKGHVIVDTSFQTNPKDRFESPIPEQFYDGSQVKAYVTIQEGCDQFCTFCVVPYTRGRELTRPSEDIISEIRELVSRGVREVTLIGQNVNGYGRNNSEGIGFSELLRRINRIDGLVRIRFTTSNPRYMTDDLLEAMRECEKVCEHLHLPVQSGSDKVLRRMGRRYTSEEYVRIVEKVRSAIPSCAITTDVIVGFPGETDKDFERTLELIRNLRFDDIFSFKFSPRPGTPASRMPDQLPEEVKAERLKALQAIQDEITKEIMNSYVGKVEEILVEGPAERNGHTDSMGRTRTNKIVNFEGKPKVGELVMVRIKEAYRNSLRGELIGSR